MSSSTTPLSRRGFVSKASLAVSALSLSASSWGRVVGANDRVRFALIGCGGRGGIVALNMVQMGGELVALCDLNERKFDRVLELIAEVQTSKPRLMKRMEEVFAASDIDAVIIATPDHWHAPATILACQAGKDVYVEKPHCHNLWESQQMLTVEAETKRIVQVGTQSRSAPYVHAAIDYIKSGKLGKVHLVKVYNLKPGKPFYLPDSGEQPRDLDWSQWLGAAADRDWHSGIYRYGWHFFWDFCGGDILNDASHQVDLACLLMGDPGLPNSVSASGGRIAHKGDDGETPDLLEVVCEYPDFLMTVEHSNYPKYMRKTTTTIRRKDEFPYWTQNATRIELYGSELMMTMGRHGGGWIVTDSGGKIVEKMYGRPPDQEHCTDFLNAVKSRKKASAHLDALHASTGLIHMANIAHRIGNQKIWWDAGKKRFKDNAAANGMMKRSYRKGFEIKV
ncbi:Gfo/Idh/MocA family protein [Pelagicoccus mobilis]|uniref:Gfo/Idh/MocA family oxidoreductase n=1 Tax=Pelagicoccus mobilis TaxID=415221 RepID=A0A934RZR2_9BACT|nr:Gfo/Idh/MocA family oxidoreductase [Pelagicoccus mobilis]MBK1879626.1 Gfo/Idh/MocA family oxidoreductase [Pelagicoccus mobilis]